MEITATTVITALITIINIVIGFTIRRLVNDLDNNTKALQKQMNEIALMKMRVEGIEEDAKHFVRMETLQLLLNNIDLRLQNIQQKLNDK